jgi:hypothetical protein
MLNIDHTIHTIEKQIKYFAKLKPWTALAKRKKHCRGNTRDFQCLLKCFPVSHIWKHWLLLQKHFPSGKQKYFLPNSETFDETLFLRLPTLVRQYDIPKHW